MNRENLKLNESRACPALHFARGQALTVPADAAFWRIKTGLVRVDFAAESPQPALMCLYAAGDCLHLNGQQIQDQSAQWLALSESVTLERVPNTDAAELLPTLWAQQQRQLQRMAALRTGMVKSRLQYLLQLMYGREAQSNLQRTQLLPLKDLAELLDTAQETVCRALNQLLPPRPRRNQSPLARLHWPQLLQSSLI